MRSGSRGGSRLGAPKLNNTHTIGLWITRKNEQGINVFSKQLLSVMIAFTNLGSIAQCNKLSGSRRRISSTDEQRVIVIGAVETELHSSQLADRGGEVGKRRVHVR